MPPDVLGGLTGIVERWDRDGIEWLCFFAPPEVRPGQDTDMLFIFQNTMDAEATVSVSLEFEKYPSIWSAKVDLVQPGILSKVDSPQTFHTWAKGSIQLHALEVASLRVPVHIRENAGEGDYAVKIDIRAKLPYGSRRLRPIGPGSKTDGNTIGSVARKAALVGLGAATGLRFRNYIGARFKVTKVGVSGKRESSIPGLKSLWTVRDWEQALQGDHKAQGPSAPVLS